MGKNWNMAESPPPPTNASTRSTAIGVYILDDHDLVSRGLREVLEAEGFEVLGATGLAEDATRQIPALRPDVSILDARLPDGTGIEVCRDVHSVDPSLPCLILTSYDDDHALRGAVLAGAAGYVLKKIGSTELLGKIRRAAAGESLFEPALKAEILAGFIHPAEEDARLAPLSMQERRVLTLIGEGLSNREIAQVMFLAEKTVRNYVSSILAKLGFQRRTQAAIYLAKGPEGQD